MTSAWRRPLVLPSRWRTKLRYEFDFRDVFATRPKAELGLAWMSAACAWCRMNVSNTSVSPRCRQCCSTCRTTRTGSATWPKILSYSGTVKDYAQKKLSWRL